MAAQSSTQAGKRHMSAIDLQRPEPGSPILHAEKVSIAFGGLKALTDFSLRLMPGDLQGLIGPNGAGKTTLFNVLTGIYKPTSGTIHLRNKLISGLPPHSI